MATQKSPLRRRIAPSTPFILHVEDASGDQDISFRLSYDLNALALIEEELGISMVTGIGELFQNPTVKNCSVLFWAAIQENHPEYAGAEGLSVLRTLITLVSLKGVVEACGTAFKGQMPRAQVEKMEKGEAEATPLVEMAANQ